MSAKQLPLDDETFEACQRVLKTAAFHGFDPVEVMHLEGLILNPAAVTRIRVETVTSLIRMLEDAKPHEILRRKFKAGAACTPEDMLIAVLDYIAAYRQAVQDNP